MNILAIGAHWDDIEIGCSLTLKRFSERGHKVYCIIMCSSHYTVGKHQGPSEEQALKQGIKAFKLFGGQYLETTKEENSKLFYSQDVMQRVEQVAEEKNIKAVFCHWFGDVHTDHQATWTIARTAFRRIDNFIMYSSNAYIDNINIFTPNYFQGFSANEYEIKRNIMRAHEKEWAYRSKRWEREIFERERFWGFLCEHDYAEGFMVTRLVNNIL